MYSEETGKILNYVTLHIKDSDVAKDLNNHRIQ
jgi:hypothetical protein